MDRMLKSCIGRRMIYQRCIYQRQIITSSLQPGDFIEIRTKSQKKYHGIVQTTSGKRINMVLGSGFTWKAMETDVVFRYPSFIKDLDEDELMWHTSKIKSTTDEMSSIFKENSDNFERIYEYLCKNGKVTFSTDDIEHVAFPNAETITCAHKLALHSYLMSNQLLFIDETNGLFKIRDAKEIKLIERLKKSVSSNDEAYQKLTKKLAEIRANPQKPVDFSPFELDFVRALFWAAFNLNSPYLSVVRTILQRFYLPVDSTGALALLKALGMHSEYSFSGCIQSLLTNDGFREIAKEVKSRDDIERGLFQIDQIKDDLSHKRHDFGELPCITIDSEGIIDVDDALSIEAGDNGTSWVYIHVADPTVSVRMGDASFTKAIDSVSTIYLAENTFPMLHEELTQKFSLEPQRHNYTFTIGVKLSDSGDLLDYKILPGIIGNIVKSSYAEVDNALRQWNMKSSLAFDEIVDTQWAAKEAKAETGVGEIVKYKKQILKLCQLAEKLREKRLSYSPSTVMTVLGKSQPIVNNSDAFFTPEDLWLRKDLKRFKVGKEFDISPNVVFDNISISKQLVAEFMVLAGNVATKIAKDAKIPIIFREQDCFVDFHKNDAQASAEIAEILSKYPSRNIHPKDSLRLIKYFAASKLSTEPGSHHILGLESYAQLTSPIRRVSDLLSQWQMKDIFRDKSIALSKAELNAIIPNIAEKEKRNKRLQFANIAHWIRCYMLLEVKSKRRESFTAYIYECIPNYRNCSLYFPEIGSRFFVPLRDVKDNRQAGDWVEMRPSVDPAKLKYGLQFAFRLQEIE